MVVLRAAHVGVLGQNAVGKERGGGRLAVETGGKDGSDRLAGPSAEREGACAARFEPSIAILARQREQTEAGAVALLGMRLGFEQMSDQVPGSDADCCRPVQQSSWSPLSMRAMRRRHVLRDRAVATTTMRASMTRYSLMTEQHFDRGAGDAQFDFLADQGMRHRVVMVRELDVVIETRDPRSFEVGIFEGSARQRPQRRPIEQVEPAAARTLEFLERPVVELAEQLPNGSVEFGQTVEAPMPQPGKNPALDQQHGGFHFGLVLRFARPRRQDSAAVMLGQRFVGAIGNRLS